MIIRVCGLQRSGTNYLQTLLNNNSLYNLSNDKIEKCTITCTGKHKRLFLFHALQEKLKRGKIEQKGLHGTRKHNIKISNLNDFLQYMGSALNEYFLYTIKAPHHWITSYHNSGLSGGASYWQMIYEYELFLKKLIHIKNEDKDHRIITHSYDYIANYPREYISLICKILNLKQEKKFNYLGNTKVPMSHDFNKKQNNHRMKIDFIYHRTNEEQRNYIESVLEPLYLQATHYYLVY